MKKRSVTIQGHRTSITLEPEFWNALEAIARARDVSLQKLIEGVDNARVIEDGGLASTLRVYVLRYYMNKI